MLSKLFGLNSKPRLTNSVVTRERIEDIHCGMAGDEHIRIIPKGTRGYATISGNNINVKFPTILNSPYNDPLVIYFTKGSSVYYKIDWSY